MKAASFENPLIPHARMRALYRALVEVRVLGERAARGDRIPKGLEACWVGTAIDLKEGDLTSDSAAAALPEYIRGIAGRTGAGVVKKAALRSVFEAPKQTFPGDAFERLLCATGAAMALKAAGAKGVAVAYVRGGELAENTWKRVLRVAAEGELPLVIVAAGTAEWSIPKVNIPVIPVDAADAVAIYRVAQESLLRARAEGGVVAIECVRTRLDPVEVMGRQLIAKGIAGPAWLSGVERGMRRVLSTV